MKPRACERLWEAEAARDGRLAGGLLADFVRHAASCEQCAHERAALERLGRALRADEDTADEVALRRARQATLKHAAALMSRALDANPGAMKFGIAAASIALLLALGFGAVELRARFAPRAPVLAMESSSDARWRRHHDPNVERIELDEGALSMKVRRSAADPRVIVQVPEGEIEDLGTVFKVTVRGGKTTEVSVTEGTVIFRRRGQADLRLSAGIVWSPLHVPLSAASERAPLLPEPTAVMKAAPAVAATSAASTSNSARIAAPHAHAARKAAEPAAHERLAGPEPAPPLAPPAFDASGEDRAYLHVLALLAESRNQEARLAASEYLRKYPRGFRRVEVDRIAHPAAPAR